MLTELAKSIVHIVWGLLTCCVQRHRTGVASHPVALGFQFVLGLGALVCFAMMVAHIVSKTKEAYYYYPSKASDGAMAFLLGALM